MVRDGGLRLVCDIAVIAPDIDLMGRFEMNRRETGEVQAATSSGKGWHHFEDIIHDGQALPGNLLESELFGYPEGAWTGSAPWP